MPKCTDTRSKTEKMQPSWRLLITTTFGLLPCAVSANAAEVVAYKYDARGRLVEVLHTGGPVDMLRTAYTYDGADNRVSVTATTGGSPPSIVLQSDLGALPTIIYSILKGQTP